LVCRALPRLGPPHNCSLISASPGSAQLTYDCWESETAVSPPCRWSYPLLKRSPFASPCPGRQLRAVPSTMGLVESWATHLLLALSTCRTRICVPFQGYCSEPRNPSSTLMNFQFHSRESQWGFLFPWREKEWGYETRGGENGRQRDQTEQRPRGGWEVGPALGFSGWGQGPAPRRVCRLQWDVGHIFRWGWSESGRRRETSLIYILKDSSLARFTMG
jgi:hypothetical protein